MHAFVHVRTAGGMVGRLDELGHNADGDRDTSTTTTTTTTTTTITTTPSDGDTIGDADVVVPFSLFDVPSVIISDTATQLNLVTATLDKKRERVRATDMVRTWHRIHPCVRTHAHTLHLAGSGGKYKDYHYHHEDLIQAVLVELVWRWTGAVVVPPSPCDAPMVGEVLEGLRRLRQIKATVAAGGGDKRACSGGGGGGPPTLTEVAAAVENNDIPVMVTFLRGTGTGVQS
jgi:hypothetical protein